MAILTPEQKELLFVLGAERNMQGGTFTNNDTELLADELSTSDPDVLEAALKYMFKIEPDINRGAERALDKMRETLHEEGKELAVRAD